ncbi:MAG TPA: DUF4249 family protein [Bacteroidia bacterium]
MKKITHIIFALFATVIFISSCEDPIDLDLGTPVEQYVIDAVIDQTTDTQYIYITKSIAYLNNGNYKGVQVDSVGILDTSNFVMHNFTYKGNGVYYYVPAPNTFKFGNSYVLVVKEGSNVYYSQSKMNTPTTVDSFTYSYEERGSFGGPEGNYVTLWAKDKVGPGDFYWFKLYRNDSVQVKANDISIAIDNSTTLGSQGDGDLFIIPIRENFTSRPYKSGEKARIEILSINPEMYTYLSLVRTQLTNQGLFAVPPSNVPSNIFCQNNPNIKLLGFFCMTGKVSTNEIVFP